ncbi:hypothetical protein [Cellulosilyticum ruminicola]|uniref:hypothetical protein n=1 Tax=Cellulosilyticum ruminicola TaxID=425254 RepID=UPI0006CFDE1F|nr:hypothetical protein [Cellulosilyticum ruminicola]
MTNTFIKQNETLLRSIAVGINLDEFREVIATGDMESSAYKNIHEYLAKVKEASDVKFLYTSSYDNSDEYFYVVDSEPMGIDDFCEYGYRENSEALSYETIVAGNAAVSDGSIGKNRFYRSWYF